jgi:major membrane immunogen (membrane-anchored lipoprotein)
MKKIGLLLLVVIASLTLLGCNNSEFKVDGEFTAFAESVHSNAPMVTMVTVKIENGEIVDYTIDAIQGTRTQTAGAETTEDTTDDVYAFVFNTESKRDLGFNYKMHYNTYAATDETPTVTEYQTWLTANNKNEWFQQADLVEAAWLANGVDSVTKNSETTVINNVAGVTIKDGGYIALAAEAVELAKAGKFQALIPSADDIYFASMVVSASGKVSDLIIDTLQGTPTGATFAWSVKTKQELGNDYAMKGVGPAYTFASGTWTASATAKATLEWYEQVALISDYVLDNGWNANLQAVGGRGGSLNGTALLDDLAGVTVHSQTYYDVLEALFACPAEGEVK